MLPELKTIVSFPALQHLLTIFLSIYAITLDKLAVTTYNSKSDGDPNICWALATGRSMCKALHVPDFIQSSYVTRLLRPRPGNDLSRSCGQCIGQHLGSSPAGMLLSAYLRYSITRVLGTPVHMGSQLWSCTSKWGVQALPQASREKAGG